MKKEEVALLRELAKRYSEIAHDPQQQQRAARWRAVNTLHRPDRIPINYHVEEFCWEEILPRASLTCEDEMARYYEMYLRRAIWQWDHLNDDTPTPDFVRYPIDFQVLNQVNPRIIPSKSRTGAYVCEPIFEEIEDLEVFNDVDFRYDEANTRRNEAQAHEIFDGIVGVQPVQMLKWGSSMFDRFCELRGMENLFFDFYDQPEFVQRGMELLTDVEIKRLKFLEENNLLIPNNGYDEISVFGYGVTPELPGPDYDPGHTRLKDMWYHVSEQSSVSISNELFEEFILPQDIRLLSLFGQTCYGCCERVDLKMDLIKRIPGLRIVSVSEWNDFGKVSEQLGQDYVYAVKPTGTKVSSPVWNQEEDEQYVRNILEKSRGSIVEIVNNTISTCHGEPERIIEWTNMTHRLCQEYSE